jgi:hypothetical protein
VVRARKFDAVGKVDGNRMLKITIKSTKMAGPPNCEVRTRVRFIVERRPPGPSSAGEAEAAGASAKASVGSGVMAGGPPTRSR